MDLSNRLAKAVGSTPDKPVRIWVLDEHRYGLLPVIRRVWARKGVRVHAPYKTTYQWGYLHEALEVDGQHKVELLFTSVVNHGFKKLNLHRIYCGTAATNKAMNQLALKLGMKEEGIRKEHLFLDGLWVDVVEYGILRQSLHPTI